MKIQMKKQIILAFLISCFFGLLGSLFFLNNVYAREDHGEPNENKIRNEIRKENREELKLEFKELKNELDSEVDEDEADEDEDEEDSNQDNWQKTKISEEEFKISGVVSELNANSFKVNSQLIYIDLTKTNEFEQKGILANDARVKVEGEIIDSKFYAEKINVIGTGQGQFKFDFKNWLSYFKFRLNPRPTPKPIATPVPIATASPTVTPLATATPSPTANATATPQASPTVSPTPVVSSSPSPSPIALVLGTEIEETRTLLQDLGVIIKMSGPVQEIESFWNQISEYFKNLFS